MFVESLAPVLQPLHLLKHPFYQAWMEGTLSKETLQTYATRYYSHVAAFPRYISAIHSKCEDATARKFLLENLNDEEGLTHGVSHPDLWLQFAEGLGVNKDEVKNTPASPAIENVKNTFFGLAQSSYAEGLGALYAYEAQVPEVAESKIRGLKENYAIEDKSTLEFFQVHQTADVYHRNVLVELLNQLSPSEKEQAQAGAQKAAQSLWDFLTEVQGEQTHACA